VKSSLRVVAWVLVLLLLVCFARGQSQNVTVTFGIQINGANPITLTPASLAFGNQTVNTTSSALVITFKNVGTTSIVISTITASSQFAETDNCVGTVTAGSSCTINVTFTPTAVATVNGTISIADNVNGSPQVVPLSGAGTAASGATCASNLPCTTGWYAIPNTSIAGVIPTYPELLLNSTGDPGQSSVMSAWGGALFDTQRNLFCFKGQGHVDGYGNDIECVNFDANPIAPLLLKDASHGTQVANVGSSPEEYSDGSPSARHTYNGFIYAPTQDNYWLMGAFRSENGNSSNYNYRFNPCTGTTFSIFCSTQTTIASGSNGWTQYLPAGGPNPGEDGSIPVWAYDPVTDAIYGVQANSGEFWEYNLAANTWTALATTDGCGSDDMTSALDPVNRFFYCIGGGYFNKVSLNSPYTMTSLASASGCSTLVAAAAPGFDWDPIQQLFVAWNGGNTYYTFSPATGTCTANTNGSFTGGPTTIASAGTFKRFQYAPTLGGFVNVNDINSNVYFLRLVSAGSAATTDFNQRIAAQGVSTSQTFSNASFLSGTDSNRDNAPFLNCNTADLTPPATCPQIFQDTSIYSTGTASMRMDCTSLSAAQCSGYWYMYLSPSIANGTIPGYWTNTDIWVSVHVRGNTQMFTTNWEAVTGTTYKHWIMHQAYPDFGSCSNVELTEVQDGSNLNGNNPYPNYYSQCGDLAFVDGATAGTSQTGVTNGVNCTNSSPCDQEGVPGYWCHYPTFTDCLTWSSVPNTWMVETYHIHLGTSGGSNSTMDAWLNKPGRPPRQFEHLTGLNMIQDAGCPGTWASGNDCYFQVLDFLVYGTDAEQTVHPTGSVWIGDVVVAINPTAVCLADHPCAIPLPNVPPANWP
jgi:centrosomal CEP192-like protein